jgi:hypothetical protein
MTATLDHPGEPAPAATASSPARRLQRTMAAARVGFTWLGVRKTLSPEQKEQAAEQFGAEGQFLSAAKKLIDTRHPAYKAVTAVRGKAVGYWRSVSLPYPEPGVRLIRQDRIDSFNRHLCELKEELAEAVDALDRHYGDLKDAARQRLGSLYNEADYPPGLKGLFDLAWEFPSVEPPDYLLRLRPELYEQEKARVAARFEEAVQLAEQAFAGEFARLLSHLTERLTGAVGEKKVFRDTAVGNLSEFFARFKNLNVRSNPDLDQLVEQAQQVVKGVGPQDLRDGDALRQRVAAQLSTVRSSLEELMVEQPRRRILRGNVVAGGGEGGGS